MNTSPTAAPKPWAGVQRRRSVTLDDVEDDRSLSEASSCSSEAGGLRKALALVTPPPEDEPDNQVTPDTAHRIIEVPSLNHPFKSATDLLLPGAPSLSLAGAKRLAEALGFRGHAELAEAVYALGNARQVCVRRAAVIHNVEDPSTAFYYVLSGSLAAGNDEEGGEQEIVGEGSFFGHRRGVDNLGSGPDARRGATRC